MILREKIDIEELINNSSNYYPDRIKFCIDRKRKVVSVDEVSVLWEAHPNINRNIQLGIGKGRELTDTKLFDILKEWIK